MTSSGRAPTIALAWLLMLWPRVAGAARSQPQWIAQSLQWRWILGVSNEFAYWESRDEEDPTSPHRRLMRVPAAGGPVETLATDLPQAPGGRLARATVPLQ